MTQLEQLKQYTTVVADTGDFQSMKAYQPQDATTNPSLILQASDHPDYQWIIEKAIKETQPLSAILERILILFGKEILQIIPGRVSAEVDARLSFDTLGTLEKARQIIAHFEKENIPRERILIKIAATWEGIRAAEILEKEGIHCNLTLMFSLTQAIACAEANVQLISPFVGRILDWFKKSTGKEYTAENDPGVASVQEIYHYYKKHDYKTEVMGASFRNKEEITHLAGCDLLTISPALLEELQSSSEPIECKLDVTSAKKSSLEKIHLDEKTFRYHFNDNAMATEKTAEGIRGFARDTLLLEEKINQMIS